jgi:hypothetical protein
LQKRLRERVRVMPLQKKIEMVAGADLSFNKFEPTVNALRRGERAPTSEPDGKEARDESEGQVSFDF